MFSIPYLMHEMFSIPYLMHIRPVIIIFQLEDIKCSPLLVFGPNGVNFERRQFCNEIRGKVKSRCPMIY